MAAQDFTLTQEYLQSLFDYKDGELYWKKIKVKNQVQVGDIAGFITTNNYKNVRLNGKKIPVHHIIFIMHYGYLPKKIDHKDNNRLNNRIENLRIATTENNNQNAIRRKDNTTGVKGVNFCKRDKRFIARIQANEANFTVKNFDAIAREAVVRILGRPDFAQRLVDEYTREGDSYKNLYEKGISEKTITDAMNAQEVVTRLEFETSATLTQLEKGEIEGFGRESVKTFPVNKPGTYQDKIKIEIDEYAEESEPGFKSMPVFVLERNSNNELLVRDETTKQLRYVRNGPMLADIIESANITEMETVAKEIRGPASPPISEAQVPDLESMERRPSRTATAPVSARIKVAPLPGGNAKRLDQIVLDLKATFGGSQLVGTSQKGALGQYLPKSRTRVVRGTTDLDTLSHEIGHALDDRYKILDKWRNATATPFDGELFKPEFSETMDDSMHEWQQRAEGFAEFLRALLVNPDEATESAPKLYAHLESLVPGDAFAKLREFGDDIRRFAGDSAVGRVASSIAMEPTSSIEDGVFRFVKRLLTRRNTDGEYKTSLADIYRKLFTDQFAPAIGAMHETFERKGLQKADQPSGLKPSENPVVLLRRIPYADQAVSVGIREGLADLDGTISTSPVTDIFKEFDQSSPEAFKKDERDLAVYMFSQRQLHEQSKEIQRARESVIAFQIAIREVSIKRLDMAHAEISKAAQSKAESARLGIAEATNLKLRDLQSQDLTLEARQLQEKKILDDASKLDLKVDAVYKKWQQRQEAKVKKSLAEWEDRKVLKAKAYYNEKARKRSEVKVVSSGGGTIDPNATARQALAELAKDQDRYAMLKRASERYREIGDWGLRLLNDAGVLSDESLVRIKDENPYWVSAMRDGIDVQDMITSAYALASHKKVVSTFKGSSRMLKNPFDSLLESVHAITNEAWRNDMLRSWVKLLETDRQMYDDKQTFEDIAFKLPAGSQVPKGKADNVITVFRNGEPESWFMSDGALAESLKEVSSGLQTNDGFTEMLLNLVSMPATMIRATVTRMPSFAARNFVRDSWQRWTGSASGSSLASSFAKRSKSDYIAYDRYGVGLANLEQIDGRKGWARVRKAIESQMSKGNESVIIAGSKLAKNAWLGYERLLEVAEKQNRLAEFKQAFSIGKTRGYSDHDSSLFAAYEARILMVDFRRSGTVSKILNRLIPFFNAGIQGQASFWSQASRNPKSVGKRLLMYAVIGIAIEEMLSELTKSSEQLHSIDPMRRMMYWNIKVGDDLWLSIPKGHEDGTIVSAVHTVIDTLSGHDPYALDGILSRSLRLMSPVDDSDILGPFKTAIEIKSNYDAFRDKNILPAWESDLALDIRSGQKYASPLGQRLHGIAGVDARQWDHIFMSAFGNVGATSIDASKMLSGDMPGYQFLAKQTGVMSVSPMYGNRDVQWVMKTCKEYGITKPAIRPLMDDYWNAQTPGQRDMASAEVTSTARYMRMEAEIESQNLTGKDKADAVRSVLSGAKKYRQSEADD